MSRNLAAAALLACACSIVHQRATEAPVRGAPSGQAGLLQYGVGRLTLLAPDAWEARGGEQRLQLSHPQNQARVDVQLVSAAYGDEKACLSAAEDALAKGSAKWTNVRRHASTFAGRRAVSQEADQGGWHGWAWAVCDGATQYQIFFAGRSPVSNDVLAAWKTLTKTATFGGGNRS